MEFLEAAHKFRIVCPRHGHDKTSYSICLISSLPFFNLSMSIVAKTQEHIDTIEAV